MRVGFVGSLAAGTFRSRVSAIPIELGKGGKPVVGKFGDLVALCSGQAFEGAMVTVPVDEVPRVAVPSIPYGDMFLQGRETVGNA
jgi:hypothetical protein